MAKILITSRSFSVKKITQLITFHYKGYQEVVLDCFPQAVIKKIVKNQYTIFEIRAFNNGMILWVLSQGFLVEIISPTSFKKKIIDELKQM
ncbi:WYL domain-containing protein [Melissococcus sp. OM08-11BH]|uniref:WYL domain-containing protein n=1 Tax=Melissococcus sp. OM08-11BH TaxID=2293110 RepID=UPI000E50AD8F|nr:WYL domain-containing protein [Melissococcus sp. OM08-11BH]